jgi:hypothetical protein
VDYWSLVECRDTSLDDTREFSDVYPSDHYRISGFIVSDKDGQFEYNHSWKPEAISEPLSADEKAELRKWILKFPHLSVKFSCTCVNDWGTRLCAEWVGVVSTFPNMTELDHSECDKYGYMITEFLEDMYQYYGVRPARILRMAGSDDNWHAGYIDDDAHFATGADMGYEGSWSELVRNSDYDKYGYILHYMAVNFHVMSPHDFDGLACFPNLRRICMDFSDIKLDTMRILENGVYVLDIPAHQEVRDLTIRVYDASLGPGSRLEIHTSCPRIRNTYLESWLTNISVVLCVDGRAPIEAELCGKQPSNLRINGLHGDELLEIQDITDL